MVPHVRSTGNLSSSGYVSTLLQAIGGACGSSDKDRY